MGRLGIGRRFTRVVASIAMVLAGFTSFGAALLFNADPAHALGTSVASPSVTLSTTAAGATNVTYTVSFATSSSGALAAGSGTISLAAAPGTVFSSGGSYTIEDVTTGTQCGLDIGSRATAGIPSP